MAGSTEYQAHAARQHAKAKEEHGRWLASLTPAQRVKLAGLGVLDAPDDSHEVGGHSPYQASDAAESPFLRVDPDLSVVDGPAELLAEQFSIPIEAARAVHAWHLAESHRALVTHQADLLSIVVGGLLASQNTRIATAALAFATEMDAAANLGSQAEFARSIGVSRTIVSRAVKQWKDQLKLRPNAYQKSDEARATYSEVAKTSHWRKAKVSASSLAKRLNQMFRKTAP